MFEIGGTELLLVAVVALLVIGPKELPRALRTVGQLTAKARGMSRHLRAGLDEMVRQAELEEMEKKWAEHNRKIMEQTPTIPEYTKKMPAGGPVEPDSSPATPQEGNSLQSAQPHTEASAQPVHNSVDETAPVATPSIPDAPVNAAATDKIEKPQP